MDEKEKSDIKFSEKFSLRMRKTFIASKILTLLLVLVLLAAFIGLNIWVNKVELPEIDVTANKIYTLSDASKKALESVNQDVKIYLFGIDEESAVVGLVKQYCQANDKISYEMLSSETNLAKVQEFELEDGYSIVVIESGESQKIIDASSEFISYDTSTYAQIDITEQTLTNSILGLSAENKPRIYFVQGHQEFGIATEDMMQAELGVLSTYLKNEAFEIANLNLTTAGSVPEDCDVLAIVSPATDFLENEANAVINYINQGGNIFLTQDVVTQGSTFPNLQKILDLYGVSVENGYIFETDSNYTASNYPYIFKPQVEGSNAITADIATDGELWLAYSEKLNFKSEEELTALNVTYEELLSTTDDAMFITDFSTNVTAAASTAQSGKFTISALVTKTLSDGTEDETEEATTENETDSEVESDGEAIDDEDETDDEDFDAEIDDEDDDEEESQKLVSKLVITANGRFFADYIIEELSVQYPLSYLGSNKDFAINAIANLADKEGGLTIRKDMAGASYIFTATENQNRVVLAIIFIIPVLIIIIGIIIWKLRKRRR